MTRRTEIEPSAPGAPGPIPLEIPPRDSETVAGEPAADHAGRRRRVAEQPTAGVVVGPSGIAVAVVGYEGEEPEVLETAELYTRLDEQASFGEALATVLRAAVQQLDVAGASVTLGLAHPEVSFQVSYVPLLTRRPTRVLRSRAGTGGRDLLIRSWPAPWFPERDHERPVLAVRSPSWLVKAAQRAARRARVKLAGIEPVGFALLRAFSNRLGSADTLVVEQWGGTTTAAVASGGQPVLSVTTAADDVVGFVAGVVDAYARLAPHSSVARVELAGPGTSAWSAQIEAQLGVSAVSVLAPGCPSLAAFGLGMADVR